MPRHPLAPLILVCALAATSRAQDAEPTPAPAPLTDKILRATLDNGLEVRVRPIVGAPRTALVLRFDFGEDADPEGQSGLAHLVEHLWVTCATADTPARPAHEWMRAYPDGSNAQTGESYTIAATVFPAERLNAELADVAARMRGLVVTEADVEREVPRLLAELTNMFGGLPALAARNLAAERVRAPISPGIRKGGVPEQVSGLTAKLCQAALAARYTPDRARLVIAGDVEPAAVLVEVRRLFGEIPRGKSQPPVVPVQRHAPGPSDEARGTMERITVTPLHGDRRSAACVAWVLPEPSDGTNYPPFLVFLTRLWMRISMQNEPVFQIACAPLDDPRFLYVTTEPRAEETPTAAGKRIEDYVRIVADKPLRKGEAGVARTQLGALLGTFRVPDAMLGTNPYGVALRLALWDGVASGAVLGEALKSVDEESFRAFVDGFLEQRAGVVVSPE